MELNYKKGNEKNFHFLSMLFEEYHVRFLYKILQSGKVIVIEIRHF